MGLHTVVGVTQGENRKRAGKTRIWAGIMLLAAAAASALLLFSGDGLDDEEVAATLHVDAVYLEPEGMIRIEYKDSANETSRVTLEILGMRESYQKVFEGSRFVEHVEFGSVPAFGWKVNPLVFAIEHDRYGSVEIKTEVHQEDEPAPDPIYTKKSGVQVPSVVIS